jgi:hypothetical protein
MIENRNIQRATPIFQNSSAVMGVLEISVDVARAIVDICHIIDASEYSGMSIRAPPTITEPNQSNNPHDQCSAPTEENADKHRLCSPLCYAS